MREFISIVEGAMPDLIQAAVLKYGITTDPRECGYLLPDGRMLDLSGRHEDSNYRRVNDRFAPKRGPDYMAGQRLVGHRDLDDEWGLPTDTEGMWEFMRQTGAIRVLPGAGFDLITPPTHRQMAMMCAMAPFYGPEVHVDIVGPDGIQSESFTDMTPGALVKFVRKAGLVP